MSLKEFNKLLSRTFDKMQRERNYLYISGDFNVNIMPHLVVAYRFKNLKIFFPPIFVFLPLVNLQGLPIILHLS